MAVIRDCMAVEKNIQAEAGRNSEFLKTLSDRELQKKLFAEFGLEEGK